ncbi:unnamed protein product [Zymoseptoria tritici ST99CH_3D7]|uniref:nitric-oxide synthase (NADPH) n=1 Tax=Zymoseptoria tritici (strain ST99CH_3D7) TaxID=1276538 RepID=A0A1X7RUZ1_ZYMT9|nr:unnamed protein product [Zymoseptoria tritici ST99CH_3D7]
MPSQEQESTAVCSSPRHIPKLAKPTPTRKHGDFTRHQQNESNSSSSSDAETEATDITSLSTSGTEVSEGLSAKEPSNDDDSPSVESVSFYDPARAIRCPAAQLELGKIAAAYPKLRPTGCTVDFCQSGRMIKTTEPRVGRDASIQEIQRDAQDFLCQLRAEDVIDSDERLQHRLNEVLVEIANTSCMSEQHTASKRNDHHAAITSSIGGSWSQSLEELRHGLRLAWKHSSKCIMRSEYQTLEVRDFRHINTSREMCTTVIAALREAFNNGKIAPTVFAFPPRQPGTRGPMFWNQQLLSFAAYEQDDGSVLGDPANLQLTKDITELGWCPPTFRTRWDLLPIVAMAEGDEPYWLEVAEKDFPLVPIAHPQLRLQFEKLGLRWVPAPALSRLGFDIGGVQYTAAPFIGWFMDAEIGVRNLADTFRYNALPQVAVALNWIRSEHEIDRLPEYERLAVLSRAQTELNFAVYHSFKTAGVAMSDTLSASTMYCNYDDEHFRAKGFRLPSNPYWLAPPQGSIVPIWHRGGAPNYQPSPLICKHVQDPVNAWRRETRKSISEAAIKRIDKTDSPLARSCSSASLQDHDVSHRQEASNDGVNQRRIYICFCSAASTAKKLANDLHSRLRCVVDNQYALNLVTTLNDFKPRKCSTEDILLIVASTAGHGEVPLNGQRFLEVSFGAEAISLLRYSIFGNGSTLYGDRYNAAATAINEHLLNQKVKPLRDGLYTGDTAQEEPPWSQFDDWYRHIVEALHVEPDLLNQVTDRKQASKAKAGMETASSYSLARIVTCARSHAQGIQHVVLDIGEQRYEPLSHVTMIVPNDSSVVKQALRTVGLKGNESAQVLHRHLSVEEYLVAFVDFDRPFLNLDWVQGWNFRRSQRHLFGRLPLREALQAFRWPWRTSIDLQSLLAAMPLKTPRMFSVASSQKVLKNGHHSGQLDLLIQHREGGLVSNYLKTIGPGACVQLKTNPTEDETLLHSTDNPIICFATGSGLAPVLSLLSHRLELIKSSQQGSDGENGRAFGAVTLILGFRKMDSSIIGQALREFIERGIIDVLLMTPSNDEKMRAQDRIFDCNVRQTLEKKLKCEGAAVFVCALPEAAADFAKNLSAMLGCNVQEALGERYVEQVYKPAC